MEYAAGFGVWVAVVTGMCVFSWLAGDLAGSARTRRLYAEPHQPDTLSASAAALRVEEWRVEGTTHPLKAALLEEGANAERATSGGTDRSREQAERAEWRRVRREALAAMGSRPHPQTDADAIHRAHTAPVRVLWEAPLATLRPREQAPEAERVLREYGRSVDALNRSSGRYAQSIAPSRDTS